mgnify:CR=1 FL=1
MEKDKNQDSIYTNKMRAGSRRTYFFDVKSTKGNDYFITITESKKRFDDGSFVKHKIFLYKEDFEKFIEALHESYDKVKELMPDYDFSRPVSPYDDEEKEMSWE